MVGVDFESDVFAIETDINSSRRASFVYFANKVIGRHWLLIRPCALNLSDAVGAANRSKVIHFLTVATYFSFRGAVPRRHMAISPTVPACCGRVSLVTVLSSLSSRWLLLTLVLLTLMLLLLSGVLLPAWLPVLRRCVNPADVRRTGAVTTVDDLNIAHHRIDGVWGHVFFHGFELHPTGQLPVYYSGYKTVSYTIISVSKIAMFSKREQSFDV